MFVNCLTCIVFLFIFLVIIYNLKINGKLKNIRVSKKFVPDTEWYPGTPSYEEYKS